MLNKTTGTSASKSDQSASFFDQLQRDEAVWLAIGGFVIPRLQGRGQWTYANSTIDNLMDFLIHRADYWSGEKESFDIHFVKVFKQCVAWWKMASFGELEALFTPKAA